MTPGLKRCLADQGGGEESREFVVRTMQELAGALARERQTVAQFVEKSQRGLLRDVFFSYGQACQPGQLGRMKS